MKKGNSLRYLIIEIKEQNQLNKKRPTQKKPNEIHMLLWVVINRNDFDNTRC